MTKQETISREEVVWTISRISGGSVSCAEDLYDSFFPKPVVPQCVADWYEEHKEDFELNLHYLSWDLIENLDENDFLNLKPSERDFRRWYHKNKTALQTLVNMHQFGYEVEKEARYTVRVKGIDGYSKYLNRDTKTQGWLFASETELERFRAHHTRKELEDAGFGWVFSCEGVEVKEVDDGND